MTVGREESAGTPRHRLRHAITLLVVSAGVLTAVIAVVPGVSFTGRPDVVLATTIVAVVSALLRPALGALAVLLGWLGVVLVGLFAQAVIFYAALRLTPGIDLSGFWPAFWAAWLYALLISAVGWVFDAHDDELFLRDVLRHARRSRTTTDLRPGVVVLQIDGLPAPLLRWEIQAGDLPTLSRWIRDGSHVFTPWRAQLPATTPASQAGILHGRSDAVPAFRWYEKESGRLTVTNHPKDAAYVEEGMSNGRGLLAGGGISIGNIFSGDAERALLTLSAGRGHKPSREFTSAYMRPFGFMRSLLRMVGEMVKELHQGHLQESRDIRPRINRRSSYIVLRALTNVLLRDLNVRLIAEQMMSGAPVIYCDFTDYDEIAHHAGPTRPESLAALAGVDRAIAVLERVARSSPRPYEFVVVSDHGQSQGATFLQRYGEPIEDVVRRHMTTATTEDVPATIASTDRDEEWGPTTALLRDVGSGTGTVARLSRQAVDRRESLTTPTAPPSLADLVVASSGNLAFVYFPRRPDRMTREEIERDHPGLIEALVAHEGIGFVVVASKYGGPVAIGADGLHHLEDGRVEGVDPLEPFGPEAAAELRRHASLDHVGDIVLNSRIDRVTGEVAAFEELVGCHGGLGGWQSEAVLVHPARWSPPAAIVGADGVHHQLVRWLEELGQRTELSARPGELVDVAGRDRQP